MARSGDINFRFSSRSSAMEGIRGHQRVQRSRGDDYVAEKEVTAGIAAGDIELTVSGRIDGYYPARSPMEVEEIKTLRVDPGEVPDSVRSVHWAQARVYAHLLAREHDSPEVVIRLCYLHLQDLTEHALEERVAADELAAWYDDLIANYLTWLRRLGDWQAERDESIGTLAFPYRRYRDGQREMAVSVYRALKQKAQLVMQAPTGIGKTMAAIFPAVKALRELAYDKVFFLTAKTSGQEIAARAVADLRSTGLRLRDITLTAKDKVCFNPGSPCDPDHCEFAAGYYDRLPGVIDAALAESESLTRAAVETLARDNTLCPFELSLDLSRIADIVICDYNYVFDPTVYLRRYFDDNSGTWAFLVDESHNLVDRGRDMFSASIDKEAFLALRRDIIDELPQVAKRLSAVNREFLALRKTDKAQFETEGHLVFSARPEKIVGTLRRFCEAAEDWLRLNRPARYQEAMLALYFDSLRFVRAAEWFDDDYACLLTHRGRTTRLKLYNLNPSPGLAKGLERASASVCFSATMAPQPYFQHLLGLAGDADWYRIASPFPGQNLGVFSAPFVSTAYRDREASLDELVHLIADVAGRRAGNYLVFFPSHAYLARTLQRFGEAYPSFRCLQQSPQMDEAAREAFLGQFQVCEQPASLIGFAVMGGVFGEGIDLKGTRLIGVIIAGVGLPQLGIERDLIRDYFDSEDFNRAGFEFAYRYPGINRVLQTAGRVIRSESDRGIVCLVDRRFAEPSYRALLPDEWRVRQTATRQELSSAIDAFWQSA